MPDEDRMSPVYAAVPATLSNPWAKGGRYHYDRGLLERLIQVQVDSGAARVSATGGLAIAVDVWVATELRRAGIKSDAVWPRSERPRSVSIALTRAVTNFHFSRQAEYRDIEQAVLDRLMASAGSARSNVLGGYFAKEVDVVMAAEDRGLEVGISTKTMSGSFAKNLGNRFEEAAGDLANLRRRYPLATIGYVYLVTSDILSEPSSWDRLKDMLRKLTSLSSADDSASYDAACLLVLDWDSQTVSLLEEETPADLAPGQFFEKVFTRLFSRSPVSEHPQARELWADSEPDGIAV